MLSGVQLFATPWTVCSLPGSYVCGISLARITHWSGVPFPPPGDLPDLGIEPVSPAAVALAGGFFTTEPPGKPRKSWNRTSMQTSDSMVHGLHFWVTLPLLRAVAIGKEPSCQCKSAGDMSLISGLGSNTQEKWQPAPVFLPEESHGQRSLASYSPWGHKELDMIEHPQLLVLHIKSHVAEAFYISS